MKKRIFGLRAKFAVLFLLFAVIIMFSVGAVTYRTYRSSMMKRYASEAVTIAKLAASGRRRAGSIQHYTGKR